METFEGQNEAHGENPGSGQCCWLPRAGRMGAGGDTQPGTAIQRMLWLRMWGNELQSSAGVPCGGEAAALEVLCGGVFEP